MFYQHDDPKKQAKQNKTKSDLFASKTMKIENTPANHFL